MSPCMKPQGRKDTMSLPDGWKIEKKKYRPEDPMKPKATSSSDEYIMLQKLFMPSIKMPVSQDDDKSGAGHSCDGQREMLYLESAEDEKSTKKMKNFDLNELPESRGDD
uniref:MBD domain-containing protein n=1 Tax=Leersia perrieri TaxID=77586 RepID=A0A0D9XBR9_9ORYZ